MRWRACIGWLALAVSLGAAACGRAADRQRRDPEKGSDERDESPADTADRDDSADPHGEDTEFAPKSDREWRRILSSKQYRVTRLKETESPGSGRYYRSKQPGTYHCVCCGAALFDSTAKFESGTGWPSFWKPADEKHIKTALDVGAVELRVEVACARCDAHLGHVFSDGPPPTGMRFCINSASLDLVAKGQQPRIGRKAETPRSKAKKVRRKKPAPKPVEPAEPGEPSSGSSTAQ